MQVKEETGKIKVRVETYDGQETSYEVPREKGTSYRQGGTASTSVFHCNVKLVGLYQPEDSNELLADVILPNNHNLCGVRVCGNLEGASFPVLLETLDINDNFRWVLMQKLPEHYRRHFINVDIVRKETIVRRLRIDPFFGESKIWDPE
jgi:hypothetical protein